MTGMPKPGYARRRGDIVSPEARSRVMSRIRGKGTRPERLTAKQLQGYGLRREGHARDLPGRTEKSDRLPSVDVPITGSQGE